MHGIFLHILADTMGSAAVMVSTALIHLTGFNGWDPLGSVVIAILIFMSSVPLIKSSARKLLLAVPDETEYLLRDTLSSVSDIRGVASYSVPRFWVSDGPVGDGEKLFGVMHVVATRGSELDEVRERINEFLVRRGVDVVVQVEAIGESGCWCGGGSVGKSPLAQ
jgi:zinc transporter 5/7